MIVDFAELGGLAGKVSMVDGGFDPLHAGHVRYIAAAAELGLPVLCNVAADDWVARKHPVVVPQAERAVVIDALRDVSYVHLSRTSTREVLGALRPRYYVKGDDWRGRLPDDEIAICASLGVEIRYTETVTNSSSRLVEEALKRASSTKEP